MANLCVFDRLMRVCWKSTARLRAEIWEVSNGIGSCCVVRVQAICFPRRFPISLGLVLKLNERHETSLLIANRRPIRFSPKCPLIVHSLHKTLTRNMPLSS